jgi:hypothetical protein
VNKRTKFFLENATNVPKDTHAVPLQKRNAVLEHTLSDNKLHVLRVQEGTTVQESTLSLLFVQTDFGHQLELSLVM